LYCLPSAVFIRLATAKDVIVLPNPVGSVSVSSLLGKPCWMRVSGIVLREKIFEKTIDIKKENWTEIEQKAEKWLEDFPPIFDGMRM